MGSASLSLNGPSASPLPPPFFRNLPTAGKAPQPDTRAHHGKHLDKDAYTANNNEIIETLFETSVYQLVARQGEIAFAKGESTAQGEAEVQGFQAAQLHFSFFEESRVEERGRFIQRTENTGKQIGGERGSSYVELSRSIATRFEASFTISGAALNGFAGTAEGAVDNQALFEQITSLARDILDAADALFEQFFSFLDGAQAPDTGKGFKDLFQELFQAYFGASQGGAPAGSAAAAQSSTQSVQLEFKFSFSAEITIEAEVQQSDPIVLDLDGDGIELSHHDAGAYFDILGSGTAVRTAFVTGGDAFLALDRNGNGSIDSGKELFGDQHGARNGYEELRKLDGNGDNVINARDAAFKDLLLFVDNGNGQTEAGELLRLSEAGIAEIGLGYAELSLRASGGNRLAQIGSYRRDDGTYGKAADAILNYLA